MIRTGIMKLLMWIIIPIAITMVFFATVDYENNSMWISFVFVWLAYLIATASCLSKWEKDLSVLNWTLYICAFGYFLTELIVAILFLYVYVDYPQWSFSVQLLLLVAYILVFGMTYIANHKTDKQMVEFCENGSRVKKWREKIALMQSDNPSKELKELIDLLSVTPINSTPNTLSLDNEIDAMIESGVQNIALVVSKIKERNIRLKTNHN